MPIGILFYDERMTAQATVATDPETDALARLGVVVQRLARGFRVASAAHGMTPSQLSVLAGVVRLGPLRMADLAEREGLNPTLLSRVVAHLEDAGLLERSTEPHDRRCVTLRVTPAGRRRQSRVRAERDGLLGAQLAALDEADRELVLGALPALERLAGLAPPPGVRR